ncbi:MAG: LysR family transcriptional regulator [Rhodobacteraceae bacterium]|nr:LysR family transcriptional regulator [Paracoccaceae bacterium]
MPSTLANHLQIKHLRLITAIADRGQVSLAAESLAMTQPAASRALAEIEAIVGTALFERHPKGMTLTPVGDGLARHARNVLDEIGSAAVAVEKLRLGHAGVVRIGAVTGAAVGLVVPAIRRLKALAPEVDLHIDVGPSEELIKGLIGLRHDMMLGRLPVGAKTSDFHLQRAIGERVRIIAHRDNRFAGRSRIGLRDLAQGEWVMQSPGAPMRQALDDAFLALGVQPPRNVTNTASLLVVLSLLQDREVVTPVSQEVADLLTGTHLDLVQLDIIETVVVAPYSLIKLASRRLLPVAARCHELMSEVLREQHQRLGKPGR